MQSRNTSTFQPEPEYVITCKFNFEVIIFKKFSLPNFKRLFIDTNSCFNVRMIIRHVFIFFDQILTKCFS